MFEIKWKKYTASVGPDYYRGYVGQWPVFIIKYAMTNDSLGDYILVDSLPGMNKQERQKSIEIAKHAAMVRLEYWMERAAQNCA